MRITNTCEYLYIFLLSSASYLPFSASESLSEQKQPQVHAEVQWVQWDKTTIKNIWHQRYRRLCECVKVCIYGSCMHENVICMLGLRVGSERSCTRAINWPSLTPRPSVSQVPGVGACVGRRAVRLPGEEGQVDAQRGQEILQTNHIRPRLLPQPLHMVC